MKATRGWRDWLPTWLMWVLGTTLGWVLHWLVSAVLTLATFWDPDEVETYLRSPEVYVLVRVLFGAVVGFVIGAAIGLIQWLVLRRRAGYAILSFLGTVLFMSLLCGLSAIGPGGVESRLMIQLRSGAVGGAIGGLLAGVWQSAILRRRLGKADGWIPVTAAGWMIVCAITWAVVASPSSEGRVVTEVLYVGAVIGVGALAGLGQWLVLRRAVKGASLWILMATLGWFVTYLLAGIDSPAAVLALLAPGVITGTALVLLSSEPAPDLAADSPSDSRDVS